MFTEVDSNKVMQRYKLAWHLLGLRYKNPTWHTRAYNLFVILVFTIYYPLHLVIGLLMTRDPREFFSNLAINFACVVCGIKHFLYYPQFERMDDISRLMRELDGHVLIQEDREFYQKHINLPTNRLLNIFALAYELVGVASFGMWFMNEQPSLMYPAWFPFDWRSSTWLNLLAVFFQLLGLQMQIIQNIGNDTYVPLGHCILSGHTQLLTSRLKRIGYDTKKTEKEHYADLVECIEDYKRVLRFFSQLEETISWNMLLQSVTNGVNLCVCVIFIVFYAEDIFELGYAGGLLIALLVEFYPGCYYGSTSEQSFHDLTYALFSCDWLNRGSAFQQNLRILSEVSLRPATMYAKNMVKINLDTYFATMKLTYSLFCVVLNMK